jgi:hypothetical protein
MSSHGVAAHWSTHAPARHDEPVAQALPHEPQFAASVWVSTHACPQASVPAGQLSMHFPAAQKGRGALQGEPQAPQ